VSKKETNKQEGGVDVKVHTFYTLALNGSAWSLSCSGYFTPW